MKFSLHKIDPALTVVSGSFAFHGVVFALALLIALVSASTTRAATAGDLDVRFGTAGKVSTAFPNFGLATDVVVQPDRKIVVVGGPFDVARYLPDGALDPSFGTGGRVTISNGLLNSQANAVALQSDGRIVVAGEADFIGPDGGIVVVRLNPNGTLDSTFGGDGIASVPVGVDYRGSASAVALGSNGSIVVVGTKTISLSPGLTDFVVVRFTPGGVLDAGFGAGGIVTTSSHARDRAYAVVVQPDGKIIAGGTTVIENFDTDFMMVRYNQNGTPDPTFGSGGTVVSTIGSRDDVIYSLALQPDGKIVTGGTVYSDSPDLSIIRYNSAGNLDIGNFGSNGKLLVDFGGDRDSAQGIAIDRDGNIVAAGYSEGTVTGGNDFILVRCENDGDLDATFGNGGRVRSDFGGNNERATGMALQPFQHPNSSTDYKIIVIGNLGVGAGSFTTARYHAHTRPIDRAVVNDFDGDRDSELALFRPSSGDWMVGYIRPSVPDVLVASVHWGASGDQPVPGDYDGDGRYDIAVYRGGGWHISNSGDNSYRSVAFGLASDIPVPGDYDGDGRTDVAVFRPSTGAWYYLRSSDQSFGAASWGANGDQPVVGDFDGDDKTDLGVFRAGVWYILRSSNGQVRTEFFGFAGDKPVVFDFDRDSKADLGVFRNGVWYYTHSSNNSFHAINWGLSGDVPVPGVYPHPFGPLAIYRNGTFWITGMEAFVGGVAGDIAVPTYFAQ